LKNATSRRFSNNFKFVNLSLFPDCNQLRFLFKIKPDISVYLPTTSDNVKTNSALAEMFIKFKWDSNNNPFSNVYETKSKDQTFLCDSNHAHNTLGQITSYAVAQLGAQF